MMVKFQIKLNESDFRLLRNLADQEYRDPKQQAGILIREALEKRGLIQPETIGDSANSRNQEVANVRSSHS